MECAVHYADKSQHFWGNVIFYDEKNFTSDGINTVICMASAKHQMQKDSPLIFNFPLLDILKKTVFR